MNKTRWPQRSSEAYKVRQHQGRSNKPIKPIKSSSFRSIRPIMDDFATITAGFPTSTDEGSGFMEHSIQKGDIPVDAESRSSWAPGGWWCAVM